MLLRFCTTLLFVGLAVSDVCGADGRRLVVMLYPQGSNAAVGNRLVEQGIRAVFEHGSAESIDVYNEHLELSAPPKSGLLKLQAEFLQRKYADRKVDVVITWLAPALDFAIEHRQEIFPGVPIVYCTVEEREINAQAAAQRSGSSCQFWTSPGRWTSPFACIRTHSTSSSLRARPSSTSTGWLSAEGLSRL